MPMTTTATNTARAPLPRGLHVHQRSRLLGGAAASLSTRERAGALAARAFAGAPPTARSLLLELDGAHGLCVLAVGEQPAAVWRFDAAALRALSEAAGSEVPRLDARAGLRGEASRLVLGMRLPALRGSIGDVVVVHDRPDAISRLVSVVLLEAIVEHVWVEPEEPSFTSGAGDAGGRCHTA
jgi:hypothetical protein